MIKLASLIAYLTVAIGLVLFGAYLFGYSRGNRQRRARERESYLSGVEQGRVDREVSRFSCIPVEAAGQRWEMQ